MPTHNNILTWEIQSTEEPGRLYNPWDCEKSDTAERLGTEQSLYVYRQKSFFVVSLSTNVGIVKYSPQNYCQITWKDVL